MTHKELKSVIKEAQRSSKTKNNFKFLKISGMTKDFELKFWWLAHIIYTNNLTKFY